MRALVPDTKEGERPKSYQTTAFPFSPPQTSLSRRESRKGKLQQQPKPPPVLPISDWPTCSHQLSRKRRSSTFPGPGSAPFLALLFNLILPPLHRWPSLSLHPPAPSPFPLHSRRQPPTQRRPFGSPRSPRPIDPPRAASGATPSSRYFLKSRSNPQYSSPPAVDGYFFFLASPSARRSPRGQSCLQHRERWPHDDIRKINQ